MQSQEPDADPGLPADRVYSRRDLARPADRPLIVVAAGLLAFLALFNLVAGIALVARANAYLATPRYVFGNLRVWGLVTVLIALVQFAAAGGVLAGGQRARWLGVAVVLVTAFGQISGLPGYPFWFLVITAVSMVMLSALAIYGRRSPARARPDRGVPGALRHRLR